MRNLTASSSVVFVILVGATAMPTRAIAASADLTVKGVIKPAACTPAIDGSGRVDYGEIAYSLLNPGSPTKLTAREVSFNITCEAPVKLALKFTDSKADSKVTGLATIASADLAEANMMGLGAVENRKIGAYSVTFKPNSVKADNEAVDTLSATDVTATWSKMAVGAFATTTVLSWSKSGATTPTAFKSLTATLSVMAVINRSDQLGMTSDMPLDGKGTIEMLYF